MQEESVGEFEDDNWTSLESLFPLPGRKYVGQVELQLIERDVGPYDDFSPKVSPEHLVVPSSRDVLSVEFEDGKYSFRFNRTHLLDGA